MSWTIRIRPDALPADRVEARNLINGLHQAESSKAAADSRLYVGREVVILSDLASVEPGTGPVGEIRLIGDFSRWDGLGFGMSCGRLIVEGDTGARTAAELAGGMVEIHGHCGPWAGAALSAGRLLIHGDAGDWLGANWPGETRGMKGGEIFVHGRAGDHTGVRMRRGLIAVGRPAGEGVGRGMIAGSIFLAEGCAGLAGLGMKRGTIVLGCGQGSEAAISATGFPRADEFRPLTLEIQLRHAARAGWLPAARLSKSNVNSRYLGDRLNHGLGEIFVMTDSTLGEEGAT